MKVLAFTLMVRDGILEPMPQQASTLWSMCDLFVHAIRILAGNFTGMMYIWTTERVSILPLPYNHEQRSIIQCGCRRENCNPFGILVSRKMLSKISISLEYVESKSVLGLMSPNVLFAGQEMALQQKIRSKEK